MSLNAPGETAGADPHAKWCGSRAILSVSRLGSMCGLFMSYFLRRSASQSFVRVCPIHSVVNVPLIVSPLILPL